MAISWRDSIATILVAIGVVVYGAWAIGSAIPGFAEPAAVAIAVLVVGIGASVSAVVPGFGELLHGSKLYLGATSAIGLVAFGAGVCTIAGADAASGLAVLTIATVVLWAMSTMRHVGVGQSHQRLLHS